MVLECNLCQDTFSIKPLRNSPNFLYSAKSSLLMFGCELYGDKDKGYRQHASE